MKIIKKEVLVKDNNTTIIKIHVQRKDKIDVYNFTPDAFNEFMDDYANKTREQDTKRDTGLPKGADVQQKEPMGNTSAPRDIIQEHKSTSNNRRRSKG